MKISEAINHFLKQHQPTIHTLGLITAVGVQLAQAIQLPLPTAIANSITFSILAYILKDISDSTYRFTPNKSYNTQEEMYRYLIHEIEKLNKVEKAILIQYTSRKASPLIWTLLNKGARVVVYVKNPDSEVINEAQKERIIREIQELPIEVRGTPGTLEVHKYDAPASVRGVMIDNRVMAIGWYSYEYVSKSNRNPNYPQGNPNDKFGIWGHDVPGMLLYKGTREFENLKELFYNQVSNYQKNIKDMGYKPLLHIKEGNNA